MQHGNFKFLIVKVNTFMILFFECLVVVHSGNIDTAPTHSWSTLCWCSLTG